MVLLLPFAFRQKKKKINRSVALNRRPEKGMAEMQSVAESALFS